VQVFLTFGIIFFLVGNSNRPALLGFKLFRHPPGLISNKGSFPLRSGTLRSGSPRSIREVHLDLEFTGMETSPLLQLLRREEGGKDWWARKRVCVGS